MLKPIGQLDWLWESRLEGRARTAHSALIAFFSELATEGRIGKKLEDGGEIDIEPLLAQHKIAQAAYDRYLKTLVEIEQVWAQYLNDQLLIVGIHVNALKSKIDAALPRRLAGLGSIVDGELRAAELESHRAIERTRGRAENAHSMAVWTNRAVTAVQLIGGLGAVAGQIRRIVGDAAVRELSMMATTKLVVGYAVAELTISVAAGFAGSQVLTRTLQSAGLNEADVEAGLAIFVALATLYSATASAGRGRFNSLAPRRVSLDGKKTPLPKVFVSERIGFKGKGRGVWDLPWNVRGEVIEKQLGHMVPPSFPTIDNSRMVQSPASRRWIRSPGTIKI